MIFATVKFAASTRFAKSVNDRVVSSNHESFFSRNLAYAKFPENKTLTKISKFTVFTCFLN